MRQRHRPRHPCRKRTRLRPHLRARPSGLRVSRFQTACSRYPSARVRPADPRVLVRRHPRSFRARAEASRSPADLEARQMKPSCRISRRAHPRPRKPNRWRRTSRSPSNSAILWTRSRRHFCGKAAWTVIRSSVSKPPICIAISRRAAQAFRCRPSIRFVPTSSSGAFPRRRIRKFRSRFQSWWSRWLRPSVPARISLPRKTSGRSKRRFSKSRSKIRRACQKPLSSRQLPLLRFALSLPSSPRPRRLLRPCLWRVPLLPRSSRFVRRRIRCPLRRSLPSKLRQRPHRLRSLVTPPLPGSVSPPRFAPPLRVERSA